MHCPRSGCLQVEREVSQWWKGVENVGEICYERKQINVDVPRKADVYGVSGMTAHTSPRVTEFAFQM
jgi:hypothetical protein